MVVTLSGSPFLRNCCERQHSDPQQSVTSDPFLAAKITSTALICVATSGIGLRIADTVPRPY